MTEIKEVINVEVDIPESLKSNCIVGKLGINLDNEFVSFTVKQCKEIRKITDEMQKENKKLNEQLKYALEVMGQIAMFSDNKTDAVQCANAICIINGWGKND